MRQSLQLRMGQQLTMTPQLQQAIRLLQLSTLDLQQEIQEALDSNPLLEVEEADYSEDAIGKNEQKSDSDDSQVTATAEEAPSEYEQESSAALNKDTVSDDLAMDVTWDEYMSAAPSTSSGPMPEDESIYQGASTETLHEYLMWQLQLTPFSPTDFWNAAVSYFPPVLILDTQSITFPRGIPLP